jgi:uncharacterized protein (DUF58 family)
MIQVSLTCIILLIIAKPVSYFNIRNVKYRRNLPHSIYKGEPFDLTMRLVNVRQVFDAFDLELNEPVIWRIGRRNIMFPAVMAGRINAYRERTRINRRGIFGLFRYSIRSQFPLGLVHNSTKGVFRDLMIVYPTPRVPPDVEALLDTSFGTGRLQHTPTSDISGEFRSMRDYVVGDHVKLISWPVSTRMQKLTVKEMEEPGPHDVSIIFHNLNTESRVLTQKSFERSLQLLSGLFLYFYNKYITFKFTASFSSWNSIIVANDHQRLEESLQSLAAAKAATETDSESLAEVIAREEKTASHIIIISNAPTDTWVDIVGQRTIPIMCLDHSDAGKMI